MTENTVNLPKSLGAWTRSDSVRIIDSNDIFDYMNGGGELYLAYRFNRLEVYEYTSEKLGDILAEVYFMGTPNDAFGLLSLDWSGQSVTFNDSSALHNESGIASSTRALYGQGFLRMATGNLYARVLVERETPELRKAILSLGQAIAVGRIPPPEPDLLKVFPQSIGKDWKLRNDRIGYFRSHLVLNSLYYLSYQNILTLDHSTEAVTAPYENARNEKNIKRIQLLFIKYATADKARQALDLFHSKYLPDHKKGSGAKDKANHIDIFNIEDGWLGYKLDGRCLIIIFECQDKTSAQMIMENISPDIKK
ncbi:MAG: hypothetical protein JRJ39_07980 [Deltaproteobacteria bacterium]|nr:hypothetical protein [Deltaproteobacteria bacterium]MBW2365048.1 hypothetical protein [Deltaproteobacteria bacterium]